MSASTTRVAAWALGGLLLPAVLAGCGGTSHLPGQNGRLQLVIHTSPFDDAWAAVAVLRLTVTGDGDSRQEEFAPGRESVELEFSPAGQATVLLEGLDIDGRVVASGRSLPFALNEGDNPPVHLLFASCGVPVRLGADLAAARFAHRAAALPDGRVLLVGGAQQGGPAAPAIFAPPEIYDPVRQRACSLADDTCPAADIDLLRIGHSLSGGDGKVLLFGGVDEGGNYLASVWLYSAAEGAFRQVSNFDPGQVEPRRDHAALSLGSGDNGRRQVLLAGGVTGSGQQARFPASALLFDFTAETFTRTSIGMTAGRADLCLLGLDTSRVLAIGGRAEAGPVKAVEIFQGQDFQPLDAGGEPAVLARARSGPQCALLDNGAVLVSGGADTFGASLATAEVIETSGSVYQPEVEDPGGELARRGALLLRDEGGRVILAGGSRSDGFGEEALDSVVALSLDDDGQKLLVDTLPPLPHRLQEAAVCELPGGGYLLSGGWNDDGPGGRASAEVWYYQP